MAFEILLLLIALGLGFFFIGIPLIKLVKLLLPQKKNPLLEAKAKLELARLEAEAAKVMKETENVYGELYKDVLEDDAQQQKERTGR
jgi:hypothetical protein